MQLTTILLTLSVAALAAATPAPIAAPATLQKRWCPRAELSAARALCEEWFGKGNNKSRKCERLLEELAAQNCQCVSADKILYDASVGRVSGWALLVLEDGSGKLDGGRKNTVR
ncbi:hypothetical protein EDC01DRAFT_778889 [Geopyxis carbonaria]|nr:hypothetical protein EDC01DRAFT_778889 [Geopyxis carbonaria]